MTDTLPAAFPPLDDILALAGSPDERDFLRLEFEPGLSYYLARLDRLMLSGDAVLDAGCGAGQWSLALARRFAHVAALDISPPRLGVVRTLADTMGATNIWPARGSIEQLPYAAGTFDAVVCYGVIMFAHVPQVVAEFQRVLKPGGRAYICLNADGWSRYLIAGRGPADSRALDAGRQTLYNTYWRRALASGFEAQLIRAARQLNAMLPAWLARLRFGPDYLVPLSPRRRRAAIAMGKRCLLSSVDGESLLRSIERDCGPEAVEQACLDAWLVGRELAGPTRAIPAEAFTPPEMRRILEHAGFEDFQWAVESGLLSDWLAAPVASKYDGYYQNSLAVWELLATKPDRRQVATPVPQRHVDAGRAAREERLYLESANPVVVSNGSWDVFPPGLIAHAQQVGIRLGGGRYLSALAKVIIDDAASNEEAVRRLIVFVQRSIFRDPISQPIGADGSMPDSLTILLGSRGRCGHTSQLLADLLRLAGIEARVKPLGRHVVAEALVDGRWVLADADAFKNGIVPVNAGGQLLSMDEIEANPHHLDTYPPTGWWIRPGSRFARGQSGGRVLGYVDALDPDRRGFVSGYYVPGVRDFPPPIPDVTRFETREGRVALEWTPAAGAVAYRVAIGSRSRGWSYEDPGAGDEILRQPERDLADLTTQNTRVALDVASHRGPMYAAVTAVSSCIEREPATFFWPSAEAVCER